MIIRTFDAAAALVGLLLLAPLLAVVALAVALTSPGPVLYRARRIGRGGVPFQLYKFRTMVAGADRIGPGITTSGDARVTPLGRWLRRTKLDELPQLFNVLLGDMSLVGPRPEDPRYVARYTNDQRRVLLARPGITSPASLAFRQEERLIAGSGWEETYCTHIMPTKIAIDLEYLQRRTLLSDIGMVLRTVAAIFC